MVLLSPASKGRAFLGHVNDDNQTVATVDVDFIKAADRDSVALFCYRCLHDQRTDLRRTDFTVDAANHRDL